ncbi:MAG: hypothetical protein HQL12_03755 [Candidatus Omnitrophica bacterium]|nr:hypothetical protein [Candidatus Omnitrophota bacterium]
MLGCLFLVLSPRIFADAFYNSKDIACLSVFIICTYTLINYLENKTFVNAFIHAIASSMLIDIRVVGGIIPALSLLFTSVDIFLMGLKGTNFLRVSLSLLAYCFFLIIFTMLFWPFLWTSPLNNFFYALSSMAHYAWPIGLVLYLGQYIRAVHVPWHYIPVWIAISTPLVYVFTFCIGYLKIIMLLWKNPGQFYRDNKSELIILLSFSLPVLTVILLKSVLYDAWRQLFFVYPYFLIISLIGLREIFGFVSRKSGSILIQKMCVILVSLNLISVASFMIKIHPYQNIYFNRLAGRNMKEVKDKFELDYWGLTFTKALEYIVTHDPDRSIRIFVDHRAYLGDSFDGVNTQMLKASDRKRLVFVKNPMEAKYFMSNYRWHKEEYPFGNEYYSIRVDGAAIVVVYRFY